MLRETPPVGELGSNMTWTKISDNFCDRLDLLGCSRSARLLYVELLVYANRMELDGRIPAAQMPRFTDAGKGELDELVAAELATVTANDLILLDWSDQEPAERIRLRRQRNTERQNRFRDCKSGDHSGCNPKHCPSARNAVTNSVTNGVSNSAPTRPVPKGQGRGQPDDASAWSSGCPECGLRDGKHVVDCDLLKDAS